MTDIFTTRLRQFAIRSNDGHLVGPVLSAADRIDADATEITRLRARVAELEAALKQAGQWFHEYGVGHHAKGAKEKAERNIERSQFCINAALKGRAGNTLDGRQHLEGPA